MKSPKHSENITKAMSLAHVSHFGQYRVGKQKIPYVEHPKAVYEILECVTDEEDILIAAWCHDLIEDTSITYNDLKNLFGKNVVDIVQEVTWINNMKDTRPKSVKRLEKISYFCEAGYQGRMVKLADHIHNLPTMIRDIPNRSLEYVIESEIMLKSMKGTNIVLESILQSIIDDYYFDRLLK